MKIVEQAWISASRLQRVGTVAWTLVAAISWVLPALLPGKSWHPWWFPLFPSAFALGMWTRVLANYRAGNQR